MPAKQKRVQTRLRDKKQPFLKSFRETCNLTLSAQLVGIDRSCHYQWLRDDPKYASDFEASLPEARANLVDDAVRLSRVGTFEPLYYQGEACYAKRKRVLCKLENGATAFLDELPKNTKIVERKTVVTADGEQLGTWRREAGLLAKLLSAWIPEFAPRIDVTAEIEITDPDDAKRELVRLVAGLAAAEATRDGDSETE